MGGVILGIAKKYIGLISMSFQGHPAGGPPQVKEALNLLRTRNLRKCTFMLSYWRD